MCGGVKGPSRRLVIKGTLNLPASFRAARTTLIGQSGRSFGSWSRFTKTAPIRRSRTGFTAAEIRPACAGENRATVGRFDARRPLGDLTPIVVAGASGACEAAVDREQLALEIVAGTAAEPRCIDGASGESVAESAGKGRRRTRNAVKMSS